MFESPNLSRYKYKICGIKSATDRCKYNVSIPVEVELKNFHNICKKNSTSSKKVIYQDVLLFQTEQIQFQQKISFNFWKVKLKRRNLQILGRSLYRYNH